MKHVFIAHSHTLFLSSMGTIDYLSLNKEDVIFLCTRNYRLPDDYSDYRSIDATQIFEECQKAHDNWKDFFHEFDELVSNWIGDYFHLYIPHFWSMLFRLLYTNEYCMKASIIQEGAFTIPVYFINKVNILRRIRWKYLTYKKFHSFRIPECIGWYTDGVLKKQKDIDVYCLYKEFFKYMPQSKTNFHIIEWPKYNGTLSLSYPQAPFFVFDGFVKNGLVEEQLYKSCCKKLIESYHSENNYLKFHPAQSNEEKEYIINIFSALKVKAIVIDSVPLELILCKFKNLNIVGFISSLLFFAKMQGHNVTCEAKWLLDSPLYKKHVEAGFPYKIEF